MRSNVVITGLEGLVNMHAYLGTENLNKARKAGISYAAKAVPPAVAKGISAAYNIKSARIKQDILGTRFVDDGEGAIIRFSRRAPTLRQFNPSPGKRGQQPGLGRGKGWGKPKPKGRPVTATIARSKGRQTYDSSFFASGLQGNQLILRRVGSGSSARLVGVYGPSIGSIFLGNSNIGPELRATVQARIQEQFQKGFERQMSAAARGFGR